MDMTLDQSEDHGSLAENKDRLRLWLKLLSHTRFMEAELRERLRLQHNTTLPQFDVMAALNRFPKGLRMSDLSGVMRVSNGNITGIVDRLTDSDIVERVSIEGDRRAWLVRLTRKGRHTFSQLAADHKLWVDELFSSISDEEVAQLSDLLDATGNLDGTKT